MKEGGAAEWHYRDKEGGRKGPVSFEKVWLYSFFLSVVSDRRSVFRWKNCTSRRRFSRRRWSGRRPWSSGPLCLTCRSFDGRSVDTFISIKKERKVQVKVCVHSNAEHQGPQLYNFGEMATACLDILIQMCEFFPSRWVKELVRFGKNIKSQQSHWLLQWVIITILNGAALVVQGQTTQSGISQERK